MDKVLEKYKKSRSIFKTEIPHPAFPNYCNTSPRNMHTSTDNRVTGLTVNTDSRLEFRHVYFLCIHVST